jgi:hypothetical protein
LKYKILYIIMMKNSGIFYLKACLAGEILSELPHDDDVDAVRPVLGQADAGGGYTPATIRGIQ